MLGLKTYIEERAVEVAKFMIHTNATVRETAKKFGISKSTVHKDITDRVERIDPELAKSVRAVLEVNKAERHIRGGLATREKYLHNKTEIKNKAISDFSDIALFFPQQCHPFPFYCNQLLLLHLFDFAHHGAAVDAEIIRKLEQRKGQ